MKARIEPIHTGAGSSFLVRQFNLPAFDHPYHYHPEVEITWIERSEGIRVIGDHVGSFLEGDLYLIGPNLPHHFRNTLEPEAGSAALVLQFDPEMWGGMLQECPEMAPFRKVLESAERGLCFRGTPARRGAKVLRNLREAPDIRRPRLFLELAEVLSATGLPGALASPGFTGLLPGAPEDKVHAACQFILEHFDEELSLEQMASRVKMSPTAFSRAFHRSSRTPYSRFLNDVRLGHACHLLMESDLSVGEIAFASGFRNLSNFNRQFLRKYGVSPREYRSDSAEMQPDS